LADPATLPPDPVAGLIDIPLPQPVSLWPQTWPMRVMLTLLFAATLVATWKFVRHWRVNRYRREALTELDRITQAAPDQLATRLSSLVRRTALAAFPRETEFSRGVGRWLASAPYTRAKPDDGQRTALVELTRRWIRMHHA
jgi:hypothetical protein